LVDGGHTTGDRPMTGNSEVWMTQKKGFQVFLFFVWVIAGCHSSYSIRNPTQVVELPLSATDMASSTLFSTPLPTKTQPLSFTLIPEVANEKLNKLLLDDTECSALCLWGIIPGRTTSDEAKNIFRNYGMNNEIITNNDKVYFNIRHEFTSGLTISANLPIINNIVESISLQISPERQKLGIEREWLAYSPETLVKRYGAPSRVDFSADWGFPTPTIEMVMYFDDKNFIIQYISEPLINQEKYQLCPLTMQFDTVRLWMGKNPIYPPSKGLSLEEVTSFSLDEFSKLLNTEPTNACFELKKWDITK
jgi:hypothetical protein